MIMFIAGLLAGLLLGGCAGVLATALAVTAARSDQAAKDHLEYLGD